MHMQGEPATMQEAPHYDDVVAEVRDFLPRAPRPAAGPASPATRSASIPASASARPSSTTSSCCETCASFTDLGLPLLVGVSRKSLIGIMTGRAAADRLVGSAALAALAVHAGAAIIRAHDVAATVDAVKVAAALRGTGPAG